MHINKEVAVTKENLDSIMQINSIIITYLDKDKNLYRMNIRKFDKLTIDNHSDLIYRFKNNIVEINNVVVKSEIAKQKSLYVEAMADYQLALKYNLMFSQTSGLLLKEDHLDEWQELLDKLHKEYKVEKP